jgi:iron complex outermembrane receptor protein
VFQSVSRTITESEKVGARVDIETPITSKLNILWGADYSHESIEQPLPIFDPDVFENSDGTEFEQIEEAFFSPPYDLESLGLFTQLNWEASNQLSISGGLRFERFEMSVDDYNALGSINFEAPQTPDPDPDGVTGGEVSFDDVVFNLGAVYDLTNEISIFANFSQGFSAPDFRRFLRDLPARAESSQPNVTEVLEITEPVVVDNYEIGVRGNWNAVQASLAGFFTYSEFSTIPPTLTSGADLGRVERAPTRTYGIEATADYQVNDQWQMGTTLTWVEGDSSPEDVDGFVPLSTRIIQPVKISLYVNNQTTSNWSNRLQLLVVGSRDRAFEETDANDNPIDPFPIESYTTLDWISSLELGSGQLTFAVQNLLDNQYFPVDSQISGTGANSEFAAALGRTVSLQYQFSW